MDKKQEQLKDKMSRAILMGIISIFLLGVFGFVILFLRAGVKIATSTKFQGLIHLLGSSLSEALKQVSIPNILEFFGIQNAGQKEWIILGILIIIIFIGALIKEMFEKRNREKGGEQ